MADRLYDFGEKQKFELNRHIEIRMVSLMNLEKLDLPGYKLEVNNLVIKLGKIVTRMETVDERAQERSDKKRLMDLAKKMEE